VISICALDGCRSLLSLFLPSVLGFLWLALRSLVGYPSRLTRLFFHFTFSSLLHYSKNKTPCSVCGSKSKPPGTGGRRIEMGTMARSYLTCLVGKLGVAGVSGWNLVNFPPFLMVLLVLHLLQFLYLRRTEREREIERKKEKEHGGTAGSDRSFWCADLDSVALY
jgi:hypothetical protein